MLGNHSGDYSCRRDQCADERLQATNGTWSVTPILFAEVKRPDNVRQLALLTVICICQDRSSEANIVFAVTMLDHA